MKSLFDLVRRSKHSIADEVDEEFGFHLDMRASEYDRVMTEILSVGGTSESIIGVRIL